MDTYDVKPQHEPHPLYGLSQGDRRAGLYLQRLSVGPRNRAASRQPVLRGPERGGAMMKNLPAGGMLALDPGALVLLPIAAARNMCDAEQSRGSQKGRFVTWGSHE
jgi:hypothetical protein